MRFQHRLRRLILAALNERGFGGGYFRGKSCLASLNAITSKVKGYDCSHTVGLSLMRHSLAHWGFHRFDTELWFFYWCKFCLFTSVLLP